MFEKISIRFSKLNGGHLLWIAVLFSEALTFVIVSSMSLFYNERITREFVITGAITAFIVSLIITAVLVALIKELRVNEKTLSELTSRLHALSIKDELTGLYNFRYFNERIDEEIDRAVRHRHAVSLIMGDIDHFKNYNDTHGHPAGDYVLKRAATCFTNSLRTHDVIARYGGEEFAIILPETGKPAAHELAERLRYMFEIEKFPDEETQPGGMITISLGVAEFPSDAVDKTSLIKMADDNLYIAKKTGKNKVIIT
ncbi:MAG: GGDEF domain-containing protein [Deltaproteobacteria bacterium]|nr:GGDEF domain-containing protein [Deltaproteobacteria bacterium]